MRSRALGGPISNRQVTTLPIGLFHVNVDPGVGIHPVHLVDRSIHGHRLVGVEFSGKGMMRDGRTIDRQQRSEGCQDAKTWSSSVDLLLLARDPSPAGRRAAGRELEAEDIREHLAAFGAGKLHQLGVRLAA